MLLSYYIGGKKSNIINCVSIYLAKEKGRERKGEKTSSRSYDSTGLFWKRSTSLSFHTPSGKSSPLGVTLICSIYSIFRWTIEQLSLNSLYLKVESTLNNNYDVIKSLAI